MGEKIRRIELGEEIVGEARESTEHINFHPMKEFSFNNNILLFLKFVSFIG